MMNPNCCCSTRLRAQHRLPIAVAVLVFACRPVGVVAGDKSPTAPPPGHVDGSRLTELAGKHGELIEVTLGKPMLKVLAKIYSKQVPGFGEFLRGLERMEAILVDIEPGRAAEATAEFNRLYEQAEQSGWERLARIRESGQTVIVYILPRGEEIAGLLVLIHESGIEGRIIFTNIVGRIDFDMLAGLVPNMDLPGLAIGLDAVKAEGTKSRERDEDDHHNEDVEIIEVDGQTESDAPVSEPQEGGQL